MSRLTHSLAALVAVLVLCADAAAQRTLSVPISDYGLVRIDGGTDVIRMADDKLERLDGRTLASVWKRGLTAADQPKLAKFKAPDDNQTATLRYVRRILTTCPDLNGDGKGDFVFGLDFQPDLVAVDGTSGEVLWWSRNRPQPDGMIRGPFGDDHRGDSFVLAEPLLYDVDGDGVPDLITGFACAGETFRDRDHQDKAVQTPQETVIQAVSGRDGHRIWSYRLDEIFFSRPGGGSSFLDYFQILGTWKGEPTVTVIAQGKMWTLTLKSGEPVGPPVQIPGLRFGESYSEHARFFDADGTGELAVLILKNGKEVNHPDGTTTPHLKIAAVRAATGEVLWEVEHEGLSLAWRPQPHSPDAPLACDWPAPFRCSTKPDDRREDVLLPFKQRRKGHSIFWHGVERLDGRTGQSVWRRRILLDFDSYARHQTIARLAAGPDLTGDGCPEVFAAFSVIDPAQQNATTKVNRAGTPNHEHVCVTALSGKDGGLLWQRQMPDGLQDSPFIGSGFDPLQWHYPAANVRPQLVVPRVDGFDGQNCFVWIIDPATGFVRDSLQGMERIDAPDGASYLLGHIPGNWNPRYTPDHGQLIQWQPSLKTDDNAGGKLPAADAAVNLPTRATFPWQERPLPWAEARSLGWDVGGCICAVLLLILLLMRRWWSFLFLLALLLVLSGAGSYWLLHNDAALMDAEEYYSHANWYGVAAITATIFVPFVGLYVVGCGVLSLVKRSSRPSKNVGWVER